jgi:hypothetical protein
MLLSTTSYLTTGREKSEVMATTNPHTLRKRVTCLCPIGLQQWSECCLRSSQGYTLGLAMPNIPTMGHSRAQKPRQGSSPSLLQKPVGTLQRYSSVNVQRFAARHIECRGYDTTVSRLHNCPREAPSRPFPQPLFRCEGPRRRLLGRLGFKKVVHFSVGVFGTLFDIVLSHNHRQSRWLEYVNRSKRLL